MNVDVALWFFAAVLIFGTANLIIAAILIRRQERVRGPLAFPVLDVLALGVLLIVLMAAVIIDVLLITPSLPTIGRLALYGLGAAFIEVARRFFTLLPNAPRWPLRFLRILEILLLVLAVIGIVLASLTRSE